MRFKKLKMKFTINNVQISAGIFLILFSVFALINYGFVSTGLVYASAFLFGNLYFVPYVIIALFGLKLVLMNKVNFFKHSFFLVGLILIFFGVLILFSVYSANDIPGSELRIGNFSTTFMSALKYNGNLPVEVFNANIGGGIIGFALCALFNSMFTSSIGTIVLCAVIILLGLLFILFKPIKNFIGYLKQSSSSSKVSKDNSKDVAVIENNNSTNNVEIFEQTNSNSNTYINNQMNENSNLKQIENAASNEPSSYNDFFDEIYSHEEPQKVDQDNFGLQNEEIKVDDKQINYDYDEEKTSNNFNAFPADAFDIFGSNSNDVDDINYSEPNNNNQININYDEFFDKLAESNRENENINPVVNTFEDEEVSVEIDDFDNQSTEINETYDFTNVSNEENFDELSNDYEDENIVVEEINIEPTPLNNVNISKRTEIIENNVVTERKNISYSENDDEEDDPAIVREAYKDLNNVEVDNYNIPYERLFEEVHNDPKVQETNNQRNIFLQDRMNVFFAENGIKAKCIEFSQGPAVTVFYITIDVKTSSNAVGNKIIDLSRYLNGAELNFNSTVPNTPYSSIEIRNVKTSIVPFVETYNKLKAKDDFKPSMFPYGISFDGTLVTADLDKTPHFLVCGITGSGKSVFENNILLSLLISNKPSDLRLLLIDPKFVELSEYEDIPHLICPPITDLSKARNALKKMCDLMDRRFETFRRAHCKKISQYNKYCEQQGLPKYPRILILIDEYANLKESVDGIEDYILKLVSKARAAGISLILVTQRPSANLISPSIKANLSSRVCFKTADGTNSRIILDEYGAEKLNGAGDMLVLDSQVGSGLVRLQGTFINDDDVPNVTNYIRSKYKPSYDEDFINLEDEIPSTEGSEALEQGMSNKEDSLLPEIMKLIFTSEYEYISSSFFVKTYSIGTTRANKISVQLQNKGILDKYFTNGKGYKVLIHSQAELDDINAEKLEKQDNME